MDYLLLTLICLVAITLLLLIILLAKSFRKSNASIPESEIYKIKEDMRASLVAEFDRISNSLDNRLDKNNAEIRNINMQVNSAFIAMNQENKQSMESLFKQLSDMNKMQSDKLFSIQASMNENIDRIRKANSEAFVDISNKTENLTKQVHDSLDNIRKENNLKLDEMRSVVEEKLQATLNERISQSFKVISENLKELHESLGSLNTLTSDVQSINKIFSNVKTRGIWGEVQAENILSEILSSEQYVKDYSPRNNREKVEFAIKLPGKNNADSVYLPIDSKFPLSDYEKYKEAIDSHNENDINSALKDVKNRVISEAKDIQRKYIVTPETTDFGILFVPAESIYIELIRIPDFVDKLQNEQRVIITGPNNFAALLNSLRLGFRTLQIEKYTSQIWHSFETLKKYFIDLSSAIEASRNAVDKAQSELEKATKKKEKLETVIVQMESSAERNSMIIEEDNPNQLMID